MSSDRPWMSVSGRPYGYSMARISSLDLLIEINQSERDAQLSHFDSLDTKSGLVLGFAGVLIALGNGAGTFAGTGSTVFAAIGH